MNPAWLILIVSLPTQNAAGRMRVWRALKALGCGVLRDGVYLLPYRKTFRQMLKAQAEDVVVGGGNAHILALDSENLEQQKSFEALFDRSADYVKWMASLPQIEELDEPNQLTQLQKQLSRLRKDFEAIVLQDFFPGAAREQAAMVLEDWEYALTERLTPDEPQAIDQRIKKLRRQDFQNRSWATRQRPWIDRLASAWLIRRFIDPNAHFIWLKESGDYPADALGFDFDGAAFTHVGAKVTFEVLLASFGLNQDAALNRLGALVHYLDVGGVPVLEAAGLETLLRGMRPRFDDDDAFLAETEKMFDAYYLVFSGHTYESN